jgi:hypothetical protein
MINKVKDSECIDALDYLSGFICEMTRDKKHYVTILMKRVANEYNIKLEFDEDEKI